MKKVNWPKIKKLTEHERVWLNKVYSMAINHQNPDYRKIKTELIKSLPIRFDPNTIDERLAGYKGTNLTLFGVYAIDPKSKLLEKINKVMNTIRDLLISDPNTSTIKAEDIAAMAKLSRTDVGLALKFVSQYGTFWRSASHSQGYGYEQIDIHGSDEIFDNFIYFTCIEDLINAYYKKKEEEEKARTIKLQFKDYAIPAEDEGFSFNPIFTSRITSIDKKLCFVLMPFTESWSERIYKKYIRENIEAMGYQCLRADNLTGHIIIEDIWTKINQAAFIIADVTGRNPNVMYELGIAHTVGKPVILITQDMKTIPFDFSHLRHYEYVDNSDGKELFGAELKRIIPEIYKETYGEN